MTLVSPVEPIAVSNKLTFSLVSVEFSGSVSGLPITEPINESLLEREGSSLVPIATKPPGLAPVSYTHLTLPTILLV